MGEDRWTPEPTHGMLQRQLGPMSWERENLREPTAYCILYPLQISVFVKILPVHWMFSLSFEQLNLLFIFG